MIKLLLCTSHTYLTEEQWRWKDPGVSTQILTSQADCFYIRFYRLFCYYKIRDLWHNIAPSLPGKGGLGMAKVPLVYLAFSVPNTQNLLFWSPSDYAIHLFKKKLKLFTANCFCQWSLMPLQFCILVFYFCNICRFHFNMSYGKSFNRCEGTFRNNITVIVVVVINHGHEWKKEKQASVLLQWRIWKDSGIIHSS